MKRLLLLTLAIVLVHGLAVGQTTMPDVGSIDIFSDAGLTSCNITDAPGLITVYLGATLGSDGSTGSVFKVEQDLTVPLSYIATSSTYLIIGDPRTNLSIVYGSCLQSANPVLIANISYIGSGTSAACGLLSIVPADGIISGMVELVTCDSYREVFAQLGQARVNADGTCDCQVPVQTKTWGGVKALYN